MPRGLIKIEDKYFEWSTIVNAPVTYGMTKEELTEYVKEEYGKKGLEELPERLERIDQTGTSFIGGGTIDDIISCNRAGKNERKLTKKQIYNKYSTTPSE